jgi:hypothetical protein
MIRKRVQLMNVYSIAIFFKEHFYTLCNEEIFPAIKVFSTAIVP